MTDTTSSEQISPLRIRMLEDTQPPKVGDAGRSHFGRGQAILLKRKRIKRKTLETRRLQHARAAA